MGLLQPWGGCPRVTGRLTLPCAPVHGAASRFPVTVRPVDTLTLDTTVHEGYAVVTVLGEVDLATAPRLRDCLTALAGDGHEQVILDLNQTEFLDSTGLGAIVTGLKRIRARGGDLRIVCTSDRVCKAFEITSLNRVLPLYRSVDDAATAGA